MTAEAPKPGDLEESPDGVFSAWPRMVAPVAEQDELVAWARCAAHAPGAAQGTLIGVPDRLQDLFLSSPRLVKVTKDYFFCHTCRRHVCEERFQMTLAGAHALNCLLMDGAFMLRFSA